MKTNACAEQARRENSTEDKKVFATIMLILGSMHYKRWILCGKHDKEIAESECQRKKPEVKCNNSETAHKWVQAERKRQFDLVVLLALTLAGLAFCCLMESRHQLSDRGRLVAYTWPIAGALIAGFFYCRRSKIRVSKVTTLVDHDWVTIRKQLICIGAVEGLAKKIWKMSDPDRANLIKGVGLRVVANDYTLVHEVFEKLTTETAVEILVTDHNGTEIEQHLLQLQMTKLLTLVSSLGIADDTRPYRKSAFERAVGKVKQKRDAMLATI